MVTSTIRVLDPRVYTDEYVTTNRNRETDGVIYERPTTPEPVLRQPILSDNFSDVNGGGRVDEVNVTYYLCERTQDSKLNLKSSTSNNTSSGISMILETTDLAPGSNAVETLPVESLSSCNILDSISVDFVVSLKRLFSIAMKYI